MIKHSALACATVAALIATSATAYADDPVPTADQVAAIMAELTDPNRPAVSKGDIVSPGFNPEEAATVDDHLNRMRDLLPLNFVITNIQPAPNNSAGATLSTTGSVHQTTNPGPIVLVEQNGHWLITQDTAMTALNAFWYNATRHKPAPFTR